MSLLDEFGKRIEAALAVVEEKESAEQPEGSSYMAELEKRYGRFQQVASAFMTAVIRPRMEKLASYFPNAALAKPVGALRCTFCFGYTARFPATVNLELGIEHDEQVENVMLTYDVNIFPVFMKYDRLDRLVLPLASANESQVATWVEEKLILFLRTYLHLAVADRGQAEVLVTDPVCGMRIRKATAEHYDYKGHPYYFCHTSCKTKFLAEPTRYVIFKVG